MGEGTGRQVRHRGLVHTPHTTYNYVFVGGKRNTYMPLFFMSEELLSAVLGVCVQGGSPCRGGAGGDAREPAQGSTLHGTGTQTIQSISTT